MVDFSWKDCKRASGVFAHITSLPSKSGIGNFGAEALEFARFLKDAGFKYWQICPTGPTGFGDSPYQSFSAFAGNPYLINMEELCALGLIGEDALHPLRALQHEACDFGKIYETLPALLDRAALAALSDAGKMKKAEDFYASPFKKFCADNAHWLDSYAHFTALKSAFGGAPWNEWAPEFRSSASFKKSKKFKDEKFLADCGCVRFIQWIFFCQRGRFMRGVRDLGLEIIGDMPIFVSFDSADVWDNPSLFDIGKDLKPRNVAGVGPDYFSEKGQMWGNPLYDWKGNRKGVYEFWRRRVASALGGMDVVRLDHFRGFADYWAIPYGSPDARSGKMLLGPGEDFFKFLKKEFPKAKFIGEDLGILTQTAADLRDDIKIPAMSVLQFAFGGGADNAYLPHNHPRGNVCYTGTHDNDTTLGWYESSPEKTKDHFRRYLRVSGEGANWEMICAAMKSVCFLAVIPLQDILDLRSGARFNTPGEAQGNWQWRFTRGQMEALKTKAAYLKELNELSWRHEESSAAIDK